MTKINQPLHDIIQQRRSVRGFKPDAIDDKTLQDVFNLAQQSPSNCNVQPWGVLLATGEACDRIRQQLTQHFMAAKPMNPDFEGLPKFEGKMRERQVECAQALYGAMGIERKDHAGRMRATARNYAFFDAPHVAFITMEKRFSPAIAVDVGMYAQTLMLAMESHGIASCAQASVAYYPDVVREFFDIDSDVGILFGISFGYEDPSVDANQARTTRAPLDEVLIHRRD